MDSPHFLGNFWSPAPLRASAIGPSRQIAYYSHFSGSTNEYGYQSREALKLYQPPAVPFSFDTAPDKSIWERECDYVDSFPPQGLEPVITSCQRAGCTVDLLEADVITRRGAVVNLSMGKEGVYDVSFVEGKLHILWKPFKKRTEVKHNGPYYGDCFEILCTRSTMQKHRGTFFSIVRRKIGDLNIIMAGEVDCSTSMNMEPSLKDYIELKTTYKVNPLFPPRWRDQLFPKWYLQSWMLGVQVLQVGYRDSRNRVLTIRQKPVNEVLRDAQKYAPYFNPDVDIGRVHAILSTLLGYFRSLGSSVSAQEKFELHVDANGDAWVTSPTNSNPTG